MKKLFVAFFLSVVALACRADNAMDTYVSQLMSRMTLEEKIGQLNLLPGGDIVTGKEMDSPLAQLTLRGQARCRAKSA